MKHPKTLSVTFCGGCNEAYDRSAFVRQLMEDLRQLPVPPDTVHRDEEADIALLVCGCHALCIAEREDCGHARMKRHILGPGTLDYLDMSLPEAKRRLLEDWT